MGVLRIHLFGGVRVEHSDQMINVKPTRKIQGLLAYLLLQRHRILPRDLLAELFWGDYDQSRARNSLNTSLWRLRCILEPNGVPSGTYLLSTNSGDIGFNRDSQYWLDVSVLEAQAEQVFSHSYDEISPNEARSLENALEVYSGDLLEGFYEDWALRERERYRALYLDCLEYLMLYQQYHGFWEKGLKYSQLILRLDPLREEIHRETMRLYLACGQRANAIRQYENCCQILRNELGVQPLEETQEMYRQIIEVGRRPVVNFSKSPGPQDILKQLHEANELLEKVRGQVLEVINSLESKPNQKT